MELRSAFFNVTENHFLVNEVHPFLYVIITSTLTLFPEKISHLLLNVEKLLSFVKRGQKTSKLVISLHFVPSGLNCTEAIERLATKPVLHYITSQH